MKSQPYSVRFDLEKDKELLAIIENKGFTATIQILWDNYTKNKQNVNIEALIENKMNLLLNQIKSSGVVIQNQPKEDIKDQTLTSTAKSILSGMKSFGK